eukprot:TRINITY_DN11206_c0_g1_i1.p1 TRINITY_DN11206_c0_g1~~TRINITY_DN11206_c0_g1_i1.p1  ORF type:complete len:414 (-),score=72.36 TRINITY_DN11206_c0_g1_i1:45-1244(-)
MLPVVWTIVLGIKLLSQHRDDDGFISSLESALRPWVMCHIWAAALVLVYYIILSRNLMNAEVCAKLPERPIGAVALLCMGMGSYALISLAKAASHTSHSSTQKKLPALPGGTAIWILGPAASMVFWIFFLSTNGPSRPPAVSSLQDVNDQLFKMLPRVNEKIHSFITTESLGDCNALWSERVERNEVLVSSPTWERYKDCMAMAGGSLAHITSQLGSGASVHPVNITAQWVKGLNTLELVEVVVQPPASLIAPEQQWQVKVIGVFTDLHVFLNVKVDGKNWYNEYICCDKPLHFTLQGTAQCQDGVGFGSMQVDLVQMDKIELAHKTELMNGPAWASLVSDAGRQGLVAEIVEDFLSFDNARKLMKSWNNKGTGVFHTLSDVISDVVKLNTGHDCIVQT